MHGIFSNPQVVDQIQKILTDAAILVGILVATALKGALGAIKDSHMNVVKKMIAERLVSYAEQTITTTGEDKAAYVAAQLKAKFPTLDEDEVKHLLEAAVVAVKATKTQETNITITPPQGETPK